MPIVSDAAVNEIQQQIDDENLGVQRTEASVGPTATVEIVKVGNVFHARIVEPDRNIYSGFGVKEVTSGKFGWEALAKMAENWKRAGFMESRESSAASLDETEVNLKVEFPSHSVRDVLDKLYDKFTAYYKLVQQVARTDKSKAGHMKLVEKALTMFVNLLSAIKASERSLY